MASSAAASMAVAPRVSTIEEGSWVVIKNERSMTVSKVTQKSRVKMGRLAFDLVSAVGLPYGVTLEVNKGKLALADEQKESIAAEIAAAAEIGEASGKAVENNRHLQMSAKGGDGTQKLTQEDIEALKEKGSKGAEIVGKVIENSATFKAKTVFSQEKYIKAKAKKYSNIVTIYRPTTRLLSQVYFAKSPEKLCYLRMDSLSGMLHRCNIRSGARVVVVDGCQGLLTGAVLARVGTTGTVLQLHQGDSPVTTAVVNYNFSEEVMANLWSFPLYGVAHVGARPPSETVEVEARVPRPDATKSADGVELSAEKIAEREARAQRKVATKARLARSSGMLQRAEVDALLIVTRFEPLPILKATLRFLGPSRPFAIFSYYKEPLVECYTWLKSRGIVGLTLTERWTQEYQVLPDRTHPHMMMDSAAGFVLSGTTTLLDKSRSSKDGSAKGERTVAATKRPAEAAPEEAEPADEAQAEASEAKRVKVDPNP